MWRTNNFFNAASPTWSANGPAHPYPYPGALAAPGTILAIAFLGADTTCNTYAWGNRGGEVQLTRNGGPTWTNLDPGAMLPPRPVNSLAFDPSQPNVLYAALSSFDDGTPGRPGHVFRTTNALAASPLWVNVSPPIDMPFNVIAVDPRNPQRIYAGSDTGLWYSGDGAATWTRQSAANGLPHAPVFDIQINPATDRTVVFTYGRGAFVLADVPDAPGTLRASAAGNVVNLEWSAPRGAARDDRPLGVPTSYVVRAGLVERESNVADFETGGVVTSLTAMAPAGTDYVRVHARNGWGPGPPSNEVSVNGGCTALPARQAGPSPPGGQSSIGCSGIYRPSTSARAPSAMLATRLMWCSGTPSSINVAPKWVMNRSNSASPIP